MIDMYCKCSSIGEAQTVLFNLKEKQVSHWNLMIAGCVQCGSLECDLLDCYDIGLFLLARFYDEEGLAPGNCYTFASALNACSSLAALDAGCAGTQDLSCILIFIYTR